MEAGFLGTHHDRPSPRAVLLRGEAWWYQCGGPQNAVRNPATGRERPDDQAGAGRGGGGVRAQPVSTDGRGRAALRTRPAVLRRSRRRRGGTGGNGPARIADWRGRIGAAR